MALLQTPLGQPETVTAAFSSTPNPPTFTGFNPATVTLTVFPPGSAQVVSTWTASVPGTVITNTGAGLFQSAIVTAVSGYWYYQWAGYDGISREVGTQVGSFWVALSPFASPAVVTLGANGYPYAFGYAQVSDVLSRMKEGNYDPSVPGNIGLDVIHTHLADASAEVDMVLARSGYTIPLVPLPSQSIAGQVWTMLRNITATYAAGTIELSRHAEDASSNDTQGERLISLADDLLTRIEEGAVDLKLFGVGGTFEFEADPAQEMSTGIIEPDPITGLTPAPLFSVYGNNSSPTDWPSTVDPRWSPNW